MNQKIIGIDPGNQQSGMVVLDGSNIVEAFNLNNKYEFYNKVKKFSIYSNINIIIEDIKPFTLQLTPQVIDTCKFIGEAVYRLKNEFKLNVTMISRYEVKKWIFDTFPDVVIPIIDRKMNRKLFEACDLNTREVVKIDNYSREKRKASFVYVDDRIVIHAMKHLYNIPTPKPGKKYDCGLQNHSWQALAVASYFIANGG